MFLIFFKNENARPASFSRTKVLKLFAVLLLLFTLIGEIDKIDKIENRHERLFCFGGPT